MHTMKSIHYLPFIIVCVCLILASSLPDSNSSEVQRRSLSFPKEGLSLQRLVHRAHPGLCCVAHEGLDVLFNGYDEIVFAGQHVIIIFDLPEDLYNVRLLDMCQGIQLVYKA